jgi:hypothetical protein
MKYLLIPFIIVLIVALRLFEIILPGSSYRASPTLDADTLFVRYVIIYLPPPPNKFPSDAHGFSVVFNNFVPRHKKKKKLTPSKGPIQRKYRR